ncbi:hypothetical protein UFOVP1479_21 [uncultured Caudovirales phage]|uniref:Uncharacterized protein n=1 Tax=uncultured Caudovirales phage TaxID=2100421 RepID=A0A6J5QPZ6_9CAUD|nr:hypothetical protein UFOVP310_23 [uncultured Caudovirales phage]CAB4152216.1 hypothetical protein UFOVP619_1 [uncultured Caudovirales phage]CAB4173013.1 hypothetical protein UFOVP947_24 [uncultured Caudovirales phage]CAB4184656.1 hypothetical protein UFOVP1114_26 [uncultured Caudovirales phage]CAB4204162.1 hypothetical protein UFOVP1386_26 [uncultured Caudovirales phage]
MGCNCKGGGRKGPIINEEIGTQLVITILVEGKIPTEEEKGLLFLYYDMIYKTRTRVNNETYQLVAMKLLDRYNQNK